jgi:putative transposase
MGWPFEAKKRYGLSVLNCTVTSNHIHFLVVDGKEAGTIPNSRQLMAGQTGRNTRSEKATAVSLLGRPLSCNGCGKQ